MRPLLSVATLPALLASGLPAQASSSDPVLEWGSAPPAFPAGAGDAVVVAITAMTPFAMSCLIPKNDPRNANRAGY
jgi:hypothetical protein